MGTLLRHIVDDIDKDLKQAKDDPKITKPQIAYYTIIVGNRLRAQHIEKRSSGAFLTTFAEVPVIKSDVPGPNLARFRHHFILPACIYDFHNDKGIVYISYSVDPELPNEKAPLTQVQFHRTTPDKLEWIYSNPSTVPDAKKPLFYRSGDTINLLGTECIDIDSVELGLMLSIPPVTEIDLDETFDFPEELILILKKQVVDMGRFALLVPEERINDAADSTTPGAVPTNKIVSVNDPVNKSDG